MNHEINPLFHRDQTARKERAAAATVNTGTN